MLVGDLVYNDGFDFNCNYAVYDCAGEEKAHHNGTGAIFSTKSDGFKKPPCAVLDMEIKCIFVSENTIVITAAKQ